MDNHHIGHYTVLLDEAITFHGHVCGGIESGTRMAICGLQRIGISDPKGVDRKKLMVFVEIDRCATDAIMSVTGCRPGKRTMKIMDYGKMAATFINLESGKAVRVVSKPRKEGDMPDFSAVADDELFFITEVQVPLRPEDMPGRPVRTAQCDSCGEKILDGRETGHQGKILCKPCLTQSSYFVPLV